MRHSGPLRAEIDELLSDIGHFAESPENCCVVGIGNNIGEAVVIYVAARRFNAVLDKHLRHQSHAAEDA